MMEPGLTGGMDAEEFRRYGKQVVDWIADYLKDPSSYPVLAKVAPGDVRRQLPAEPPASPEAMENILSDFNRVILPGITHWNHPGFLAYFAISGSAPGILGEMLSAALNVNGMLWRTSPAATELEEVVLDWLRQMIGLPTGFSGVITDTASVSSLVALAAAREALHQQIRERGMAGRTDLGRLRLYCSDQAHSSIDKAAIVLGIGQEGVRKIPSDDAFRMMPDTLERAIDEDRRDGWIPFCVVATAGTTSTTSIDPVPAVAEICRRECLWLHVDGAYGGVAGIVPELRPLLTGIEHADSMVVNPHKWMFTPIDCSVLFTRRTDVLWQAFSLVPDYLKTVEKNVTNYMDWGVQLGRRFRALKLWFVIRSFGVEGIRSHIRAHCALAQEFAGWIDASPTFERLAPVPLSVVCFRFHPKGMDDEGRLEQLNMRLLDAVNANGEVFLSHTKLHGRYSLHLAVGNLATRKRHIARAWTLLQECASKLESR